jgi:hypothetical protein
LDPRNYTLPGERRSIFWSSHKYIFIGIIFSFEHFST